MRDFKSVYTYKTTYLLWPSLNTQQVKTEFPNESHYFSTEANGKWCHGEVMALRNLNFARYTLIKYCDDFAKLNVLEYNRSDKARLQIAQRIPENIYIYLERNDIDLKTIYKQKPDGGVLGTVNFISKWIYNNAERILTDIGIPYAKHLAEALFIYPAFQTISQLKNFKNLRLQTAIKNSIVIPKGPALTEEEKQNFFKSDMYFYEIVNKVLSDEFKEENGEIDIQSFGEPTLISTLRESEEQPTKSIESEPTTAEPEPQPSPELISEPIATPKPTESEDFDITKYHLNVRQTNKLSVPSSYRLQLQKSLEKYIKGDKVLVSIDCDNADYYITLRFCNWLKSVVDISSIQLFLDNKTNHIWSMFESYFTELPVNINYSTRIKDEKSSVDLSLGMDIIQRINMKETKTPLIISSDCDYFQIIETVNRFFEPGTINPVICYEDRMTNKDYIAKLNGKNIFSMDLQSEFGRALMIEDSLVKDSFRFTLIESLYNKRLCEWTKADAMSHIQSLINRYKIGSDSRKLSKWIDSELENMRIELSPKGGLTVKLENISIIGQ